MMSGELIELDRMASESQSHMLAEEIERYSAGTASEGETERWDEHLLVCGECRQLVSEQDDYHAAMRSAARKLGSAAKERVPRSWRWFPVWLPATAALAVVVLCAALWLPRWNRTPAPFAVTLSTARGPAIAANAPARTPLSLTADLTGLPAQSSYRLEVVDAVGRRVWRGSVAGDARKTALPGLGSGIYFARVYSPEGGLLREYELRIGDLPRP